MIIRSNSLTVVYGGFWGSEGKGQLCAHISAGLQEHAAIRVGGPNAGHTITDMTGVERKLQQVPVAAFVNMGAQALLGPSAVVDVEVMKRELGWLQEVNPLAYVLVDGMAVVIQHSDQQEELTLKESIGSTGEGVGAATAGKVMRSAPLARQFAREWQKELPRVYIVDTVEHVLDNVRGEPVMIEGTQGYLLSLDHSRYYPFVTSRNCGPDDIIAQTGLSPRHYQEVHTVCVMRTYPIRVGGNSGPLPDEITWDELHQESGGYVVEPERTTVTKKIRRISRWSDGVARWVCRRTRPDMLCITFLDYLFPETAGARSLRDLSADSLSWLADKQRLLGAPVRWVSCGKGQEHTFKVNVS